MRFFYESLNSLSMIIWIDISFSFIIMFNIYKLTLIKMHSKQNQIWVVYETSMLWYN